MLVALLIIVVGGYWTFQGRRNQVSQPADVSQDLTSTEEEWKISPESVGFEGTVQVESDTGFEGFTVPGQIHFPDDSDPESVELIVRILPLSTDWIDQLKAEASGGNLDEVATRYVRSDTWSQDPLRKVLVTDSQGRFSISNAPPGLYRAEIRGDEWLGSTQGSLVQRPGDVTELEVDARPSARLVGRVVDSNGEPVSGVSIRSLRSSQTVRTDENGEFVFGPISPGEPVDYLQLENEAVESRSLSLSSFDPGEVREKTFEITRARELTVQVRTESGQPVQQGSVLLRRVDDKQLRPGQGELREGMRTQSVDSEGTVLFAGLRPGRVQVNLHHPRLMAEWTSANLDRTQNEVRLTALRGHELTVEIQDESTGEPIRDLLPRIVVFDQQGNLLRPGLRGHRREGGTFNAVLHPQFSEGVMRLDGERRGYEPRTLRFDRGDLNRIKVSLAVAEQNRGDKPPAFQKLRLSESRNSEDVESLDLFFVDRRSGEIVQTRTGSHSILEESIPLPTGEFIVYGRAQLSRGRQRIVGQKLAVESDHPDSKPIMLEEPARVIGEIQGPSDDGSVEGLEVAVDLLGDSNEDVFFARDYPEPLRATPDEDGRFIFESVPVGVPLELHVVTTRRNDLELPPGTIVKRESIGPLSPNERFTLPTLRLP